MSEQDGTSELQREEIERVTYFWDRLRGISAGVNDAIFTTFVLLITIRVFEATSLQKSIVASALWIGMFLMPVFLWVSSYFRLRCNLACVIYTSTTAVCFTATVFSPTTEFFVLAVSCSMIVGVQGFTLLPRILAENYRPEIRGKRVSTTVMISGIVFMICSLLFAHLLDTNLDNYVWVLASAAGAYYAVAFFYLNMPSPRLERPKSRFPYHTVQLLWKNPVFFILALLWSLLEFGNYMMLPIRMEYLANDIYQINLSNTQITWLLALVPLAFSLTTSRIWGLLFDRFRVETVQAMMGGFLILSVVLFFMSSNYWSMLVSMAIFGISLGAQKVLSQLWITKVVPIHAIAEYTSAFSILNGIRGILAPLTAYWLLDRLIPAQAGFFAASVIAIGTVGLLWLRRLANPSKVS